MGNAVPLCDAAGSLAGEIPLNSIRVIIAGMQPLMRQIVEKAIADEADMILAASLDRLEDLDVIAEQSRADVVIASESDAFSKKMQDLLEASRPTLFVIGADGRHVTQYALLLDQHTVEDISLSNLVDAVRAAARDRGQHSKKKDQAERGT
jgi:hypothetical protein